VYSLLTWWLDSHDPDRAVVGQCRQPKPSRTSHESAISQLHPRRL